VLQTLSSYVPVTLINPSLSSVITVLIDEVAGQFLHLRTAKDAGAAKDTQRQSRRRSVDSSSSQLRAQTESSSQHPGTEEHDKQDVERPNRQRMLSRFHP